MNKSESKFNKVMGPWDILVIAFGAMIGWGWVINSGDWIANAGFIGSIIAFLIGGAMVVFVGLTYAELTAAMPQCGGEHVFSYRAMGPTGSFICTWAIILGYVATAAFEAVALPTVVTYIFPHFNQVYLYTIAGRDIYLSTVVLGCVMAVLITAINLAGAKTAAILQTILTALIACAGLLLIGASVVNGDIANVAGQLWSHTDSTGAAQSVGNGVLKVACMTPFLFIGFDVIPQAAEEINVQYKKIGGIMLLSIGLAVVWYLMVVFAVSYIMPKETILNEINSQNGLVAAKAMEIAFHSPAMANVLIIGGFCGIITSWNSFLMGGSRAMYSMGESRMLPKIFGELGKEKDTNSCYFTCRLLLFYCSFLWQGCVIMVSRCSIIWLLFCISYGFNFIPYFKI